MTATANTLAPRADDDSAANRISITATVGVLLLLVIAGVALFVASEVSAGRSELASLRREIAAARQDLAAVRAQIERPAPTARWEYRVETPYDFMFDEEMRKLGADGWELVSARRASASGSMAYEMIFRRPVRTETAAPH